MVCWKLMVPWLQESRDLSPLLSRILSHLPQPSQLLTCPLSLLCHCPHTQSLPLLSALHQCSQTPIENHQTSSTTLSIAKIWIPTFTGLTWRLLWITILNTATHTPCRPTGSLLSGKAAQPSNGMSHPLISTA